MPTALPPNARKGARFATRLAGASGRGLLIDGAWRPVFGLADGQVRGSLLHLEVREEMGVGSSRPCDPTALNPIDRERLDLAALEHAFAAQDAVEAGPHPPLLFLPIFWSTMRSPRARRQILHMVGHAQARLKVVPIAELRGIDAGIPAADLREGAAELRPIFRAVLARLTPKRATVTQMAGCGLSGASVEVGDMAEGEGAVQPVVSALRGVGPNVMLHSLRSVAALMAAREAGATWASLDVVRAGLHLIPAAQDAFAVAGLTKTKEAAQRAAS